MVKHAIMISISFGKGYPTVYKYLDIGTKEYKARPLQVEHRRPRKVFRSVLQYRSSQSAGLSIEQDAAKQNPVFESSRLVNLHL